MSLTIRNLSKSFGEKKIFDKFSLELPWCGIYAVVGDSGVGKTTLLRMIAGLDKDFSGEIFGGGISNTALVFQEYRLFPELSAIDNVIFANNDKRTQEAISDAENTLYNLGFIKEDMSLFPSELSGGMKQRVSFARGLLRQAPILLLDEPTKELDADNAARLLDLLKKEAEKRLVIIVTHKDSDIKYLSAIKINI